MNKNIFKYIACLATGIAAAAGLVSCQDDIDAPAMKVPVATMQPNTTIAELKAEFWQDAPNYVYGANNADPNEWPAPLGTKPDGSHYIIHGTVVSSDEPGNVFKSMTIQDETGAISFSINRYNLYLNYRPGQEIVVDATGLYLGKYAGLMQFGGPSYYDNGKCWQVGFSAPERFTKNVELNGLPDKAAIDTLTVDGFDKLSNTPEGLRYWQSRLVRFNNVHFAEGGKRAFSVYHSNVNDSIQRNLIDAAGNSLVVRTSGYANFATKMLPEGNGDVVGLLGYYESLSGTTTWQLTLIDYEGCMNFGNPTLNPGAESNPWTVDQAIEVEKAGTAANGWVTGYIVGAMAPEVTSVTSNSDIEWTSTPVLDNTLVIGQTPDTKDIEHALIIELPYGSDLQALGNLVNNPGNYGKQIWINGSLAKVYNTYGVTGNNGATGTWRIEGQNAGGVTSLNENFDASTELPEGWTQKQVAGNKTWYVATFNNNNYASMTGYKGTAPFDQWLISPAVNLDGCADKNLTFDTQVNGYGSTTTTIEAYILDSDDPATAGLKDVLPAKFATAPATSYSGWVASGNLDLSKYSGTVYIAFRYAATSDANYATWCVDNVKLNAGSTPTPPGPSTEGSGTEADPYSVGSVIAFNPSSTTEGDHNGVWVKGYIVGWADMSTTYYINAETARFSAPATMKTNLLMAATPDCKDVAKCIGIQLPSGAIRNALNLQDNPGNLGKEMSVKGDILKYSGVPGVRNVSEYKLDGGGETPTPPSADPVTTINQNFDASEEIPAGWTQFRVAGNKDWYINTFNNNNYAAMTGYKGTAPFDQWLITPPVDIAKCTDKKLTFDTQVNGYGSTTTTFEVYVLNDPDPSKASVKTKLNPAIATAPASSYSDWVNSGSLDLSSYSGNIYIGFRYTATADANYATWCVDNVKLNAEGGDTPTPPDPTPSGDYKGDFNSFNGGAPKSSPYGTYTNATGWTATNSIVLGGTDSDTDANPRFKFIGDAKTLAPTLNGKASAPGTLTSPVLTGGIKTLTFNYGFAFSDTKCQFTVNIKDASGNVVKTDTVTLDSITKLTAYSYSLDVNYTGSFTIEIVNNSYSAATSNKDRVSIWNLTWTD